MGRGCVIALIAFGVGVLALVVLVVVVPMFVFDIIDSAPRVPVATFVSDATVAVAAVDPNKQQLISMLDQGGSRFSWFLPHEAGAVVDLDPAGKARTVTLIGSPKHLGPLFLYMFNSSEAFSSGAMEARGIDAWETKGLAREKGAIVLRGTGAVEAQSEELAAKHWPEAAPRTPAKLEGGHAVEIAIANEGGAGIRALEPFFRIEPGTDAAATPEAVAVDAEAAEAKPSEAPVAEAAPAEDAAKQPEGAAETAPEFSAAGFLEYATSLRLVGDFTEGGDFKIVLTVHAKDAATAARAVTLLDGLRDLVRTEMEKDNITVAGATTVSGDVVTGEIVYSGYQEQFSKWLRDMQQSRY